jgi:hypothetical protein
MQIRFWVVGLSIFVVTTLIRVSSLGGQVMGEEQILKLLRGFIALEPDEVSGFKVKGRVTSRTNTKWGVVSLNLFQTLIRTGINVPGRDPTEIAVKFFLFPKREIAHEAALLLTTSQRVYPDSAGMPKGSWTGLPIGEKSWYSGVFPEGTQPAPGFGSAVLVVWDDKLALRVEVHYQPIGGPKAKTAIFLPIAKEDLELGELAARIILARANMVLLGWHELPKVRLVVNGKELEGRKGRSGQVFVPVRALMDGMGGRFERRRGVVTVSFGGKRVVMPIGAREMMVGKERVKLSMPILWDGKELWVEGEGVAKGLGLAMRWERGKLILAKR